MKSCLAQDRKLHLIETVFYWIKGWYLSISLILSTKKNTVHDTNVIHIRVFGIRQPFITASAPRMSVRHKHANRAGVSTKDARNYKVSIHYNSTVAVIVFTDLQEFNCEACAYRVLIVRQFEHEDGAELQATKCYNPIVCTVKQWIKHGWS